MLRSGFRLRSLPSEDLNGPGGSTSEVALLPSYQVSADDSQEALVHHCFHGLPEWPLPAHCPGSQGESRNVFNVLFLEVKLRHCCKNQLVRKVNPIHVRGLQSERRVTGSHSRGSLLYLTAQGRDLNNFRNASMYVSA